MRKLEVLWNMCPVKNLLSSKPVLFPIHIYLPDAIQDY